MNKLSIKLLIGISIFAGVANGDDYLFRASRFKATDNSRPIGAIYVQNEFALFGLADQKLSRSDKLYAINTSLVHEASLLSQYGELVWTNPKVPFVVMRLESELEVGKLSGLLHESGMSCGGIVALSGNAIQAAKPFSAPLISPKIKMPLVEKAVATVGAKNIEASIVEISNIHTRYHKSASGQTVADQLATLYSALAVGRSDVTIAPYEHSGKTNQPSLVVRITGQTSPDEIVVLGSHLDSINYWGGTNGRSPGADDNASGTATNIEVFRSMMESGYYPDRSIEIHAYAAEEIGLVGSDAIASDYAAANKNVVSMVQHDMNLYSKDGSVKVWLVSNNTSSELNGILETLIDSYVGVAHERKSLSGGNSDHYSWTTNGFNAAFPFENPSEYNDNIHTERDTIANSGNFEQAAAFARLGVAYLMHYAGGS